MPVSREHKCAPGPGDSNANLTGQPRAGALRRFAADRDVKPTPGEGFKLHELFLECCTRNDTGLSSNSTFPCEKESS